MDPEKQSSKAAIDNELFQMYAHYQLCRVKKGTTDSSSATEKNAIVQILEACQHINANTFHTLVDDLLKHSIQLEPFDEGGLTTLFDSTNVNNPNVLPSVSSSLNRAPQLNGHVGRKTFKVNHKLSQSLIPHAALPQALGLDRQYSPRQSGSEGSDDEGTHVMTPKRKRARSSTITESRQGSSAPDLQSVKGYVLSDSSRRDLAHMSAVPEKTKQELFQRMKKITDSFRIDYSVSQEGKVPVKSFDIHFMERFSPQSINNQCQTNFVAYQIGQIIEREARIFPHKLQEENKRLYYTKGLNKTKTKLGEINKYCKSLSRVVNEIGVYCLFLPEILPPTFYRRADEELFRKVIDEMNEKFPHFGTIASIDENGNLYIADIEDVGEDEKENMDRDVEEEEEEESVDEDTEEVIDRDEFNDMDRDLGLDVDTIADKDTDKDMDELASEDDGDIMADDIKDNIKAEMVECGVQKLNGDTSGWQTL